jgi:LacI family transcriptional regulator
MVCIHFWTVISRRENEATLKDVAERAGVHAATVSRSLDPARQHLVNPKTRDRVLAVAEELGYRVNTVAQSLRKGLTGLVGVLVADVANPFVAPLLRGIEQELRPQGAMLIIAETHDDSQRLATALDNFAKRRVDAVILTAALQGDESQVRDAAGGMPVVLAVRTLPSGDWPSVTHDDVLGGRLAAQHLVDRGHRRLAQLKGSSRNSSFRERSAGYESVMATTTARDVTGDAIASAPTVEEGVRLTGMLLDREPQNVPTAIFAHNDLLAVGAIAAIKERGLRCPDDISVVGYNDSPLTGHFDPPLTTVRLPTLELGRQAAKIVIDILAGAESIDATPPLPPELIVRGTTAPADTNAELATG